MSKDINREFRNFIRQEKVPSRKIRVAIAVLVALGVTSLPYFLTHSGRAEETGSFVTKPDATRAIPTIAPTLELRATGPSTGNHEPTATPTSTATTEVRERSDITNISPATSAEMVFDRFEQITIDGKKAWQAIYISSDDPRPLRGTLYFGENPPNN